LAKRDRHAQRKTMSLMLVEGETDEVFYGRVKNDHLRSIRCRVREVGGLFNINNKIVDAVFRYCDDHAQDSVRVYCCLDRESRNGVIPGFDLKTVVGRIKENGLQQVLSIDVVRATQQIESWFFHDISSIYEHLQTPKSQRNLRRYCPPEKFGYKDLQRLFAQYGKTYNKGKRAASFIKKLDLPKILAQCDEFRMGVELIQARADDLTNYLAYSLQKR